MPSTLFSAFNSRRSVVLTLCLLALGGCGTHTALEPQNRPVDARQGRIYFIRHAAILGLSPIGSAEIKVDGKPVGSLTSGSYLVVDRPPGPHTIATNNSIVTSEFESDILIQPGMTYYFEIGPVVIINADALKLDTMRITGQPVPGRAKHGATFRFYALDATAGAEAVARTKPETLRALAER